MTATARDSASITRSQSFAAVVRKSKVDGRASLNVVSNRFFQHQLNKFQDEEKVTLEIHNRKPKRTEQQNRYYWGAYLPIIAKETGEHDLDALHELFKGKFLSDGIVEVLGEKVRKKKSTTDLGVGDFCEFIMNIQALTGIEPPPTENWELAPLREGVKEKEYGKTQERHSGNSGGEEGEGDGGNDSDEHSEAVAPSPRTSERKTAKKSSSRAPSKRNTNAAGDRTASAGSD